MKTNRIVSTMLVLGVAVGVRAQDHASCPMAASHEHREQVDRRHEQVTGVGHEGTRHHFVLASDGGSIRLEVEDDSQRAERDRARGHLQAIARAFAVGDFSMPMQIHDRVPPGVEVMEARKALIRYRYSPTARGGVVRISTDDPEAVTAVHEFLAFQIKDHGTGDPTG